MLSQILKAQVIYYKMSSSIKDVKAYLDTLTEDIKIWRTVTKLNRDYVIKAMLTFQDDKNS